MSISILILLILLALFCVLTAYSAIVVSARISRLEDKEILNALISESKDEDDGEIEKNNS